MRGNRIAAIADDLTGALEAGAHFAAHGFRAVVTIVPELAAVSAQRRLCDVLVFDTQTRHLAAAEAFSVVSRLAGELRAGGFRRLYKKTDSTLRGNIGAELSAVAAGGEPVFYAPAYPELGRTVRHGRLFVHGMPVDQTAFARDPFEPVNEGDIFRMLEPWFAGRIERPADWGAPRDGVLYVFDGETAEDSLHAAKYIAAGGGWIAAGPAGLAKALASVLGTAQPVAVPRAGRTLVVNGSLHEMSAAQVTAASWPQVDFDSPLPEAEWMILRPDPAPAAASARYARMRATRIAGLIERAGISTLVVFGGDTVRAIVEEMRTPEIESIGELLAGVALSRLERGLLLASKAGGFGGPDTLLSLRELLS